MRPVAHQYIAALGSGILVLAASIALWAWLTTFESYPEGAMRAIYFAPALAAAIASFMAPGFKFVIGMSMGPIDAALSTATYLFAPMLGLTLDRIGTGTIFLLSLAFATLFALGGSVIGIQLSGRGNSELRPGVTIRRR